MKWSHLSKPPYYVRIDSATSRVYRLWPGDSTEYLEFTLDAKIGDITDNWNQTRCEYIREKTLFGRKVPVKGLVGRVVYGTELTELAWGFGMSYYKYDGHGPNYYTRLIGTTIDGVNYGSLTSVDHRPSSVIPDRFVLHPNYPNPFNASTVIRYDLPVSSFVTLEIYNLLGQKMRTLVTEQKPAGHFEIRWDGTNELGLAVTSGMYFYQLKTIGSQRGTSTQVRKLLLIR